LPSQTSPYPPNPICHARATGWLSRLLLPGVASRSFGVTTRFTPVYRQPGGAEGV